MADGLAAIARGVDHGAIAIDKIFLAGNFGGGGEQLAEQWSGAHGCFSQRCDVTAWRDENVCWRGGIDVGEGKAIVVLIDRGGGNASVNNFAKETAHSNILQKNSVRKDAAQSLRMIVTPYECNGSQALSTPKVVNWMRNQVMQMR